MEVYGQVFADDFRPRRTWNRQRGWQTTRVVRGLDTEIEGLLSDLLAGGVTELDIDPEPDTPYAALRYSWGHLDDGSNPESVLLDTWSLAGNDLEKSLWEHPKIIAATSPPFMTDQGLALFRRDVENALNAQTPPAATPFASPLAVANATIRSTLVSFYRSLLRGVESFTVSQYVLRHTRTVDPGTNLRPIQTNVNRVFTTGQLTSVEAVPNTLLFVLPAGVWLKRTPTVEQSSNGKWQFTQEYWHADSFDPFAYDRAL